MKDQLERAQLEKTIFEQKIRALQSLAASEKQVKQQISEAQRLQKRQVAALKRKMRQIQENARVNQDKTREKELEKEAKMLRVALEGHTAKILSLEKKLSEQQNYDTNEGMDNESTESAIEGLLKQMRKKQEEADQLQDKLKLQQ